MPIFSFIEELSYRYLTDCEISNTGPFIDPRILSEDFVQKSHIDFSPTGDQPSQGSLDLDPQMAVDLSDPIDSPPEASPEIRVEGMAPWLYDTYHAGENTRRQ